MKISCRPLVFTSKNAFKAFVKNKKWFGTSLLHEFWRSISPVDLLACNFIKNETLAQVFSCEFWRTYFMAASIISKYLRVCLFDKMSPIYFLCLSKVWSILHHGSVWQVRKKMLLNAFKYFFGCLLLFFIIKFVFFIIFISFSDKVSNYRNRILTNQKRELVVSNCQWNCLLRNQLKFHNSMKL